MAVRKEEAVASFPVRLVRPVFHRVEIGDGEHIGDVQRLGDVSLALHLAHQHRIAADVIGPVGERLVGPLSHG